MGLSFDQLFPGRFIKAGEMHGKAVTLTLKSIYLDDIEKEDGTSKPQAVATFVEVKREWAVNRTNASAMRAMWGDDTDAWLGKRITLFPEADTTGMSESGVCLRVQGSPDIPKTITVAIKLPRRRPTERKLTKTAPGGSGSFDVDTGGVSPPPDDPTDAELNEMFAAEGEEK